MPKERYISWVWNGYRAYGVCSNLASSGEPPASQNHFNHCAELLEFREKRRIPRLSRKADSSTHAALMPEIVYWRPLQRCPQPLAHSALRSTDFFLDPRIDSASLVDENSQRQTWRRNCSLMSIYYFLISV